MKKVFFAVLIVAGAMTACTNNSGGNSANETNASYLARNADIYPAIETGDASKVKDWIAADAVDHSANDGRDVKGADSIITLLRNIHNSFQPGFKMTVINQATDGNYLYALVRMEGTTTANPGKGMPQNTKMDMQSVDVLKIKDGKASEHWAYVNPADMTKMMAFDKSAMPPPGPQPPVMDTAKH